MNINKKIFNAGIFLIIMILTFYTVFRGQDWRQVRAALGRLSFPCLVLAVVTALFFVSAEGMMIWYLLRSMDFGRSGLLRCIVYSFIGFFYSGITPSATGGQPMQLYYMKKDGHSLTDSSVVLMSVALMYKLVLVIIGVLILGFWSVPLKGYLREYFVLYLVGLGLNIILVTLLLAVMLVPGGMKGIIYKAEAILIRIGIFKESEERRDKIEQFIEGYQGAVQFLASKKQKIALVVVFTFLQRFSVFFLTAIVYLGFSQRGTPLLTVMFLQASVYIAVDMLPLPGGQGITELMYCHVFRNVFTPSYLMPSLYVTRGINFYFLLIVSLFVAAGNRVCMYINKYIRNKNRTGIKSRIENRIEK